ncbi:MAG TPA: nucleotide sugar dehydrogenase [Vicinamibacterales bacterium]|nr:nucleotide sugar dehydrogenase [Vicinamibacterales bacterium]
MKVCVSGLWHLGSVTAACLAAAGHEVAALDSDGAAIESLSNGIPPVAEPGLAELLAGGIASGRLRFGVDAAAQVPEADVVWIAADTPVDDDDRADVEAVVRSAAALFPHLRSGAVVLISSQVPVGTSRRLSQMFERVAAGRSVQFVYSPENLRLGKAIDAFTHPSRVIVGTVGDVDRSTVAELLRPFTDRIVWMSAESAEMTKHALNAFLAASIAFINEIAALCEQVGADAADVARGLKSDPRIGEQAYLSPGGAFAGGTLARDVMFLSQLGREHGVGAHLLRSVKTSNDEHRQWAQRRIADRLGDVNGRAIAVWGLTYKPGTDTLRRSSAVELCRWLRARGAAVRAHDPAVRQLPPELADIIDLVDDPLDAVRGASALVVATPWPEYRNADAAAVAGRMSRPLVLDAGRFLAAAFAPHPGLEYISVGVGG